MQNYFCSTEVTEIIPLSWKSLCKTSGRVRHAKGNKSFKPLEPFPAAFLHPKLLSVHIK